MPYRPPELFEGGLRTGDPPVDFQAVDVWSLGCTFFAVLYGASPSESEFARPNGQLRIVDCTQLKVLGGIPQLPPQCAAASWYSKDTLGLIQDMLVQDRSKRPTMSHILSQLEQLIEKKGGRVVELEKPTSMSNLYLDGDDLDGDDDNDMGSLLNSNRGFV